tara:strand:+ start:5722 stop:5886 length:165 start_codon:yes stop_codon:yes gene_type:complete
MKRWADSSDLVADLFFVLGLLTLLLLSGIFIKCRYDDCRTAGGEAVYCLLDAGS